jgi:FHA domain
VTVRSTRRRRTRLGGGLGLGAGVSAIVAAADEELLDHIRASTPPEAAVAAIHAANIPDTYAILAQPMPVHGLRTIVTRPRRWRRARIRTRPKWRRRWAACGAAALVLWLAILTVTGSVRLATMALPVLTVWAAACVIVMRWWGVSTGHPWARGLASRPWRDGCDVLNAAVRDLNQVFIGMPGEVLLAPNAVELLMNPTDLGWLANLIDLQLVNLSIAERYEAEVARHAARLDSDDPITVNVASDPAVPVGRYRLRRHRPCADANATGQLRPAAGQSSTSASQLSTSASGQVAQPELTGLAISGTAVAATAQPVVSMAPLRLVTNGAVAETRLPHARVGRGWEAELQLPEDRTVSRVHAEFTFAGGQWWITSRGRNGLVLNGNPMSGEQVVRTGDKIRWGQHRDALVSLVEIG